MNPGPRGPKPRILARLDDGPKVAPGAGFEPARPLRGNGSLAAAQTPCHLEPAALGRSATPAPDSSIGFAGFYPMEASVTVWRSAGDLVSREGFASALRALLDRGFRFTIIGGTVVELELGSKDLGDDVDLFGEEPSPLFEEEYRAVAEELGWSIGQTWLGTPQLIARVGQEEIPIEFYENIHDFYVPSEMLERAIRIDVAGVRVKAVRLEDHIALKAHAGRSSDMERLKEIGRLAKRGKIRVDRKALEEAVSFFGDEAKVVARRLREAGLL